MPANTFPKFNRYPVLWLALCFAAGIILGRLFGGDATTFLAGAAAAVVIAVLVRRKRIFAGVIGVAFLLAGAGMYRAELTWVSRDRVKVMYDDGAIASGSPVEIEGVVAGRPEAAPDGAFLLVHVDSITGQGSTRNARGRVRMFVPITSDNFKFETSNLKYGSRIRVACALKREDEFLNPGVLTRREMLDRLGVDATCTVKSPLLVEHLADESVFMPLAWVYDQRAKLIETFRDSLSPRTAGVMIASLLGNKYFLDKDTADLFRDGGTFHILIISGLHITFIGGLLLLIVRPLTRNRWIQFAVTTAILWAYTLAVGAEVPVVRAALMFTIVLFGYAIYRTSTLLNSLGLCALIVLVWRPSELFDPSFQLTFVSVAAIIGCAYPLIEHLRSIGGWTPSPSTPFPPNVPLWLRRSCETLYWNAEAWRANSGRQIWTASLSKRPFLGGRANGFVQTAARYVFEAVVVSVIVQIWMLPLTVVYFHRVSIASVLLNLWVGSFIAIESFAAVAGAVVAGISGFLAAGLFAIAEAANWMMLSVPRQISDPGWSSFRLPAYVGAGRAIYFVYFFPVMLLAFAINSWKPFSLKIQPIIGRASIVAAVAIFVLSAVIVFHPFSVTPPEGTLRVHFLDVGQGDSAFIEFPNGQTMLIDAGGRVNYRQDDDEDDTGFERDVRGIGEAVVSEVLWSKGYDRVDYIAATHADADHIQGLVDVAKNFKIGMALIGQVPTEDAEFDALAEVLDRRGIRSQLVSRGDVLRIGEVSVEVLHPTGATPAQSSNDRSLVLRLSFGDRTFLFTGDIESAAEADLLAGGVGLSGDVVKVAHHGSRTSSTAPFVDASLPEYSIISVGRRSPFGHPHQEVVDRWRAAGATVLTTGEKGMISVATDGIGLEIVSFRNNE